ncbi:MAG: Ig-like domain-containing protein [Arhodomonas sp.]|nr:Ig-like domain-containing protein [Arhodomonas sp.]
MTAAAGGASSSTEVVIPPEIQVAAIELSTSADTLGTSPESTIVVTAVAKDSENRVLEGIEVSFGSDSGELVVQEGETDASGRATATLSPGQDTTPRIIAVSASAGQANDSIQVPVEQANLSLSLSASASTIGTTPR